MMLDQPITVLMLNSLLPGGYTALVWSVRYVLSTILHVLIRRMLERYVHNFPHGMTSRSIYETFIIRFGCSNMIIQLPERAGNFPA